MGRDGKPIGSEDIKKVSKLSLILLFLAVQMVLFACLLRPLLEQSRPPTISLYVDKVTFSPFPKYYLRVKALIFYCVVYQGLNRVKQSVASSSPCVYVCSWWRRIWALTPVPLSWDTCREAVPPPPSTESWQVSLSLSSLYHPVSFTLSLFHPLSLSLSLSLYAYEQKHV